MDARLKKLKEHLRLSWREINVVLSVFAAWVFLTYIVPELVGLMRNWGEELPRAAQYLISASDFIIGYFPPLTILSIFFVYLIFKLRKRKNP